MSDRYRVERRIRATPGRIWSLLTDPVGYGEWNPAVVSLAGKVACGEKIALVSVVDPKRTFHLTVTECEAPQTMTWSSSMPLGIFRGTRTFLLESEGENTTRFSMEEVFSGPLKPLMTKVIPDMTESFEQFADGLKAAAEAQR